MKNIALLGSNGFLAVNIYKRLKNKYRFIRIGSKNCDIKYNYKKNSLTEIIYKYNFDAIINCVGLANIDYCEENTKLADELNINFVNKIANTIKKFNINSHVIHISTDQVYDNEGYSKEEQIKINNYYSYTKIMSEISLKEINSTILRTNFIGKSLHYKKKSLSDWITSSLKKDMKINVFKDILFNPITFKSLMPILEIIIKKKVNGIYNLGSDVGLSKSMLAFKIAENLNKTSLINYCDSRDFFKVKRSNDMRMNCDKFKRKFNIDLPNIEEEIINL